ncbi:hypothetical protein [Acrocarpospora sp. B8E8]|uniref:hypothetical protein n=1 Tax=Acrocarpospora sp. B8E8 TaxID=3153572 RepID=UPI00325E2962
MAIIEQYFLPEEAQFLASPFPAYENALGTNFPVPRLKFSASADLAAFFYFNAHAYGSGDITCDLYWYALNATSNSVRWGVSLAVITPETDSQDIETKVFATEHAWDDAHLGTTSKRVMKATQAISNLDSVAAGDACVLRVRRIGSHGNDNLANEAGLIGVRLSYSN